MGYKHAIFPLTRKLNPFVANNLKGLAEALILTRLGVGLVRVITDIPAFNHNPSSPREKAQNLLERIFTEGLGTVGCFLTLQTSMDLWSALSGKGLHMNKWLSGIKNSDKLSPEDKTKITDAFRKTFHAEPHQTLNGRQVIAESLLHKGNLGSFVTNLNDKSLLSLSDTGHLEYGAKKGAGFLKQHSEAFFSHLNHKGVSTALFGILVSAFMSGAPVQKLNDNVIRHRLAPWLLDKIYGSEKQPSPASPSLSSSTTAQQVSTFNIVAPAETALSNGTKFSAFSYPGQSARLQKTFQNNMVTSNNAVRKQASFNGGGSLWR